MNAARGLGLAVSLVVLICAGLGCPHPEPDGPSGGSSGDASPSELILGEWRLYVQYEGVPETDTDILNVYANGTCETYTLGRESIWGSWYVRADGIVVVDIDDARQLGHVWLRQIFSLKLRVRGDDLTGTIWARICLDLDCETFEGTVEGVRLGKSEDPFVDTDAFWDSPIIGFAPWSIKEHSLFAP